MTERDKEKLCIIAEKHGITTQASSAGSIIGRIEHIRDELTGREEEVFKEVVNDLGFSDLISSNNENTEEYE